MPYLTLLEVPVPLRKLTSIRFLQRAGASLKFLISVLFLASSNTSLITAPVVSSSLNHDSPFTILFALNSF